jgi:O-antigen biosynthesis protein
MKLPGKRWGIETHTLRLKPVHHLAPDPSGKPGEWVSTGNDPQFLIHGQFAAGWNELRFFAQAKKSGPRMTVYFATDSNFVQAQSEELGMMAQAPGWYTRYLYLPEECNTLRFDPLDCEGGFNLRDVTIRSIVHPKAVARLGGNVLWHVASTRRSENLFHYARTLVTSGPKGIMKKAMKSYLATQSWPLPDPTGNDHYPEYLKANALSAEQLSQMRAQSTRMDWKPVFSIVVPTYNVEARWLRAMIHSVLAQAYPYWELCIADDASTQPHVRQVLEEYRQKDPRIKVIYREKNGHISASTNTAMTLATGEYYCLLDNDDEIAPESLFEFARLLNQDPKLDLIYSDEDKLSLDGKRYEPFFKPEWSPEYLESAMYTAHFACYRKAIADEIGGFRKECNGAQDYDFVLRFTEKTQRIAHIPRVLYHWRAIPGSTAQNMNGKDYVLGAAIRALEGRLQRTGREGTARVSRYPGCFDVRYRLPRFPRVSILLPSAAREATIRGQTVNLLLNCIDSLKTKTSYPDLEIIVIGNEDLPAAIRSAVERAGCKVTIFTEPDFNIAKKINQGAKLATGEYLLILNDDVEAISPDWIEAMLEQGLKSGVGVVGAKLLYEAGTLQHVGVTFCRGLPDHIRKHYAREDPGYFFSTTSVKNYLAVTGACMLTPRALFEKVGGYSEQFPINYNDIDYCLKCGEEGFRVVYTPHAELTHFESMSRQAVVGLREIETFLEKWNHKSKRDPFYNEAVLDAHPPNFALRRWGDASPTTQ